jgi:hypothetical protein
LLDDEAHNGAGRCGVKPDVQETGPAISTDRIAELPLSLSAIA